MGSKHNPGRRNELCDAAIRLLARQGIRAVTHLKVDREVGLPDGTTSFYYRRRSALIQAVAERVNALDLEQLTAAARLTVPNSRPSALAKLVVTAASGSQQMRTKARYALLQEAGIDPALGEVLMRNSEQYLSLIRAAVETFNPSDTMPSTAQLDEQAYAVMHFINGVMFSFTRDDYESPSAAQLDRCFTAIVLGLAAQS